MTLLSAPARPPSPIARLANQPYVLLALMALFWAGNIVLGRFVAHHVPPVTLTAIRWLGASALLLPFAWSHLRRDWPTIRRNLPQLAMLALTGFAINNALAYWGLQYTQALNALLVQSSGPLFVALWALLLFGIRLTLAQGLGITLSLTGVLTILLRGDVATLAAIAFNRGDIMITMALVVFGLYSALVMRRPKIHALSLTAFTMGLGGLMLVPGAAWEAWHGNTLTFDAITMATVAYVVIFPSALAYLFFNRGIALIGPNRAAPFFHLIPVFGSAMAILFLGERLQLFHLVGYALVLAGIAFASRK
ncbi:MAG: EamA family transporter [Proteobacteria bacterium]|nr:MAG: EamA family transporter [Pseudomonadota bacterium]